MGTAARRETPSTARRWCVYLLRCGDGTLYAGITNDVQKRLHAHRTGRGARYTRGRGPLTLVHCEPVADKSAALKREHALKRLPRAQKLLVCRRLSRPKARPE
jgi:putative endonuclease